MEKLTKVFITIFIFLVGCSGFEESEKKRIEQSNLRIEAIDRKHDERLMVPETPTHRLREPYPWEESSVKPKLKCHPNDSKEL